MTAEMLIALSKIKKEFLSDENRNLLTERYRNYIMVRSNENELLPIIGRINKCSRRVARTYLPVLHALGVSDSKLRKIVGQ